MATKRDELRAIAADRKARVDAAISDTEKRLVALKAQQVKLTMWADEIERLPAEGVRR